MIERLNYSKMKEALQDYIRGGDYSHPFVIAGWTSTGKTALVNEVLKENELFDSYQPYTSPAGFRKADAKLSDKKANCIISLSEGDALAEAQDFLDYLDVAHNKPVIVEQTYQNEEFLKMFEDSESTVHVLKFDLDEWLGYLSLKGYNARFIEFLKKQPLELIHVGYAKNPLNSHTFPTPGRWEALGVEWPKFSMALSRLGTDAANAVAEALKH